MGFIKAVLMLIGALVVGALIFGAVKMGGNISKMDPRAVGPYMKMAQDVLATGNAAGAMTRKVMIDDDVSTEDVLEAMKSIAEEENMQLVGDTTMFDGSVDESGHKTKYTRIVSFCSRTIAKDFLGYSPEFGSFMPCRIMIREDDEGHRWMYSMAMELMLYGGYKLPDDLMEEAEHVRDTMYKLMDLPAKGDF